jgi:small subunit ribosomal protein S6
MYIIKATLSDKARQEALGRIENDITRRNGKILKVHDQGRRRLAYEIDGQREGHYFVLYFNANPEEIDEMWREYHLNEDLVRFVTLRADKVMEKIEFKSLETQQ